MSLIFWGLTLGIIGKVMLGASVILVHSKITKERNIDRFVLMEMKRERIIALFGIVLMVLGYFLELGFYRFIDGGLLFGV